MGCGIDKNRKSVIPNPKSKIREVAIEAIYETFGNDCNHLSFIRVMLRGSMCGCFVCRSVSDGKGL